MDISTSLQSLAPFLALSTIMVVKYTPELQTYRTHKPQLFSCRKVMPICFHTERDMATPQVHRLQKTCQRLAVPPITTG